MSQRNEDRPRPRVKDVARLAGVSVGTVSNVLNGRAINDDMRARVEAAIQELGYLRNATAQALRTGISPLVGVALLDITNPFYMVAASGMEARLNEDGCVMALSSTGSDRLKEADLLRTLAGQGVRGIVLTPTDRSLAAARETARRGVPIVLFDYSPGASDMSSVSVDNEAGSALAINHLVQLGHRRILFLNGPKHLTQSIQRRQGVEKALRKTKLAGHQVTCHVRYVPFTAQAGREATRQLLCQAQDGLDKRGTSRTLNLNELPTAIFCANDLIAFGVANALMEAGVRIPQDISVVGFDDIAMASEMAVPLTTVRQPMMELGWMAADMLLSNPLSVRHEKVAPTLMVRRSTAPPRE